MDFATEISILFTGMSPLVIVLVALGLIFTIVEIYMPGFGVFGILGGLLLLAGIICRVIVGDGSWIAQSCLMLFFIAVILMIAFGVMYILSKKGVLSRSPFIERNTAVKEGFSDGTEDYSSLIDSVGVVQTDLRPVGKAEINGKLYDVTSGSEYIAKGQSVKVTSVEGIKITVMLQNKK